MTQPDTWGGVTPVVRLPEAYQHGPVITGETEEEAGMTEEEYRRALARERILARRHLNGLVAETRKSLGLGPRPVRWETPLTPYEQRVAMDDALRGVRVAFGHMAQAARAALKAFEPIRRTLEAQGWQYDPETHTWIQGIPSR